MGLLEVSDIHKREDGKLILEGVSFTHEAGKKTAITGESGAGKTTLLKIIGGLIQPDRGRVLFGGKRVEGPLERLIAGHRQIAYLSQHFELRNHYRVREVLEMANLLPAEAAMEMYRICRIDHLLTRWTSQLSGGEKQRIALARLLGSAPALLLLDEPFSNLDPIHKNILRSVIDGIGGQLHINCLLTSHDPRDTLSWADDVIVMKAGRIVQRDTPVEIYHRPSSDYVAGMFGAYMTVNDELIAAFPKLASGSKEYLRPEDFRIASGSERSAELTVTDTRFMGSHYEIDAVIVTGQVTLRSKESYPAGARINVAVDL